MQLRELAETLGVVPAPVGPAAAGDPAAFAPETILRDAVSLGLDPALADAMRPAAGRLAADLSLAAYFSGLAGALFPERPDTGKRALLPERIGRLSESDEYVFFALLALSAAPSRERVFVSDGLPADAAQGAVRDVCVWIDHFFRNRGIAGISARILNWEYHVLNGVPLTLGRLQFVLKQFGEDLHVFRNAGGEVRALASDGERFNRDGVCDGVDGKHDPDAWTARFAETAETVTGNPITPDGRAHRGPVTLSKSSWKCVFRRGDWTLETHIPEGAPLEIDACREAMKRALEFFSRRRPDATIRAFSCLSWLLDPQYETILPPDSRILRFMRQYYLFPIPESGEDACWRIFGEDGLKNGLSAAPRRTRMQRRTAEFLERGGELRSGGGFLLPEELGRYGGEPYRRP